MDEFAREIVFNSSPPDIRFHLLKRPVQEDIQRRTGTIVMIKGRYSPPKAPYDAIEGALRLRIQPGSAGPVSVGPVCFYALAAVTSAAQALVGGCFVAAYAASHMHTCCLTHDPTKVVLGKS